MGEVIPWKPDEPEFGGGDGGGGSHMECGECGSRLFRLVAFGNVLCADCMEVLELAWMETGEEE